MIGKLRIDYNGQKHIVELKTLTLGQKNQCLRDSMSLVKQGAVVTKKLDEVKYETLCCVASITKAPFATTIEEFEKLDAPVAEQIYAVYKKLHKVEVPEIVEDGDNTE